MSNHTIPPSPYVSKILDAAHHEASLMDAHYVGSEHILLAILRNSDSVASKILECDGVQLR